MGGSSHNSKAHKCGLTEVLIFLGAIVSGTACSICSKLMMQLRGIGLDGTEEVFEKPIFQTFGMFIGMLFGLVMHWVVVWFRIPFPGYFHTSSDSPPDRVSSKNEIATENDALIPSKSVAIQNGSSVSEETQELPLWMYFLLAVPSLFDLGATAFCMMGLRYLDVSIYQMLRGSGIIFVALMKQHVLKHALYRFQWIGVFWNVISVILVGATAMFNASSDSIDNKVPPGKALAGIVLVLMGAFVQALQFVFEEKLMNMDIPTPPLLLIGMEGFWSTLVCLVAVYPICYYMPGDDHGSYESPLNTWVMFKNSSTIQVAFVIYFFAIFFYNLLAILVTYMLNSIWHAILDNFRPITIWITSVSIYYFVSKDFGEPWTKWSIIQLIGLVVLLLGTAIYNAPNAGSIRLEGQWFSLGFNFKEDYDEIEMDFEESRLDEEWEEKMQDFKKRRGSSIYGEHSPHVSVHTQALRGLASPKI